MKSYFKFLSRNKLYTAIEAVGLAVSLAFVLLTGHFVWQQRLMTRNVPDYQDVYTFYRTTGTRSGIGQSWGFAYQAKESIPEVEKAAMFWKARQNEEDIAEVGGQKYHVSSYMVGGDFFDIFPAEFDYGGPEVLTDISNVIVSRAFANSLGGVEQALGRTLDGKYTIAAVIKETPNPIFGDVDIISSIENLTNRKNSPFMLDVIPFVKVRKGTARAALEVKADTLVARAFDVFGARDFLNDSGLIRYDEIWFSPANNQSLRQGNPLFTGVILLVTIILLLSAIFNYINLNVALSSKRAKEMATRKILGAGEKALIGGYLLESFAFTAICFLLAVLLAEACTPWFNRIIGAVVPVMVQYTPGWLAVYALFIVLISVIQGLLPAWIGTRMPAIAVVKGEYRARHKHVFSKVFIVLQQVFSIILLALALILGLQVSHMAHRPMGADVEGDFYVQLDDWGLRDLFAKQAASLSCVNRIGRSTYFPGMAEEWESEDKDKGKIKMAIITCDSTAFDIFGFDVRERFQEPVEGTVWISEQEMTRFGVNRNTENLKYHHVLGESLGGIIGDFAAIDVLSYGSDVGSYVIISPVEELYGLLIETTGDRAEAERQLKDLYQELCMKYLGIEDKPYMFGYISDILSAGLTEVRARLKLVEVFMLLSLLLSILGLTAMSSYYANESAKDIAIRKVFGSTMQDEVRKSVLEYLTLLAIAAFVAVPLAIYLAARLLQPYPYRVSGCGWVFIAAVAIATLIAFASVLWQTLKAARTNPAIELKKE
ncbi:MAG: FtsX-like permease family protein [Bacteroidales bacterium]|nr:FtsX-like permease family protein [Bacteroidales bacterium]